MKLNNTIYQGIFNRLYEKMAGSERVEACEENKEYDASLNENVSDETLDLYIQTKAGTQVLCTYTYQGELITKYIKPAGNA